MNFIDAISTFQFGKKSYTPATLTTPWGECLDSDNVLPDYPRPQMRRNLWTNLNGLWDYAITKDSAPPSKYDGSILVPFSPECQLSGVNRKLLPDEFLWYRRDFILDSVPAGKRLLLHFGAVDQDCIVFVSGKRAGSHVGGYLAFSLDITKYIKCGSNLLTVKVRDESDRSWKNRGKQKLDPSGMFYTAQSGIWQTVWLEWVPDRYIRNIRITPLFDDHAVEIDIQIPHACEKKIEIYAHGKLLTEEVFHNATVTIPLPEIFPWSPEHPFLYDLRIQAGDDMVESYFALRKFSHNIDDNGIPRLFLNNKPYFQNGVLDQGYWPDGLYTAPSDEALIFDIQSMKDLGFNMIRKHLKIEPMRWYYHCDRLGMIVWQDMINGGGRPLMIFLCYLPTALPFVTTRFKDNHYPLFSRTSKKGRRQWMKECRAAVEQLYNCPCIGMWVPFNEGWGQFDALEVTEKMRTWDNTRLIDHASGWYDQKGGDVKSIHNYFRILTIEPEARPYVLSEYGGYVCHIKEHSYSDQTFGYRKFASLADYKKAFRKLQKNIKELEKKGLAAAVYTQLSDIEEETNGIFTYDRKVCKL